MLGEPLSHFLQVVAVAQQDVLLGFGLRGVFAGTLDEGGFALLEHVRLDIVVLPDLSF